MSDVEEEFEAVDAGASETIPIQAGSLKKGSYVCINGRPAKVVDYSTSKTGKHGHAKASITAIDIFNGNKYEDSQPTSHNMECPVIKRTEWQAIAIDGEGYVTLMDKKGNIKSDLNFSLNSGDLNTEQVWYLNGQKEVGCQMVWYSNAI